MELGRKFKKSDTNLDKVIGGEVHTAEGQFETDGDTNAVYAVTDEKGRCIGTYAQESVAESIAETGSNLKVEIMDPEMPYLFFSEVSGGKEKEDLKKKDPTEEITKRDFKNSKDSYFFLSQVSGGREKENIKEKDLQEEINREGFKDSEKTYSFLSHVSGGKEEVSNFSEIEE